jgi:hypothetical protein
MSIQKFNAQIRSQNGSLISALRKLADSADPARLIEEVSLMEGWELWPELNQKSAAQMAVSG